MISVKMVVSLALFSAPFIAGHASGFYYDGPISNIPHVTHPPAHLRLCDKYVVDRDKRRLAACRLAQEEAGRFARIYGGSAARVYGFHRGYAWGLHKMARMTENDGYEMSHGEGSVETLSAQFENGLLDVKADGSEYGQSRGRSDAISRFEAVLNTGSEPDSSVRIPSVSFSGISNPYTKYVGPIPHASYVISNELSPTPFPVYGGHDPVYVGPITHMTVLELWNHHGNFYYNPTRWFDPRTAFNRWKRRHTPARERYRRLDNRPFYDNMNHHIVLKNVFEEVFRHAYRNRIRFAFSRIFHQNLDIGQQNGEITGRQLGLRLAYYKGLVRGFNQQFTSQSFGAYNQGFANGYTGSFNSTFTTYQSNPVLSISFNGVTGFINDGIIEPGERISAIFTVKNLGGVPSDLNTRLSGDVIEATPEQHSIGRYSSRQFRTDFIARIDPRLDPRDTARLTLHVNNLKDYFGQVVHNIMEISSVTKALNIQNGSGTVRVVVHNISTVETAGEVKAVLSLNGQKVDTQNIGKIGAGKTGNVVLSFSNVDPLLMINSQLEGDVRVTMMNRELDKAVKALSTSDKELDLAKYYTMLVNGTGFIPSTTFAEARIADVYDLVVKANETEIFAFIKEDNIWKKNPSSTMVGKLGDQYKSYQLSADAKAAFNELAIRLYQERGRFGSFMGIKSAKRKAYEALCEQIWCKAAGGGTELSQHQDGMLQGQNPGQR